LFSHKLVDYFGDTYIVGNATPPNWALITH